MKKITDLIKRNTFLIGVAVLLVAGAVTIVGLFLPWRSANAAEVTKLESQQQSVSKYASDAGLHSEKDVPAADALAKTYQDSLNEMRSHLAAQGQPLDEPLQERTPQGNIPATDGSIWKLVYEQDVDKLLKSLQKSFLVVGATPIVAQEYGDEIPDSKEIQTQTRYLRVQQFVIDAIAGLNKGPNALTVPVFNGFTFLSQPERLLSTAHSQNFTPIPFQVRVSTNFTNIPRVLHSLLASPVQIQITSISIDRPKQLDRGAPGKKAWAARTQRAKAPTKVASAAPPPSPTAPPPTSAGPGGPGGAPPGAQIAQWQAMAEQMRQQQLQVFQQQEEAAKAAEAAQRAAMAQQYGSASPSGGQPTVVRHATARQSKGTEMTEEIKAQLPKTLVDLTIRGYVADYEPPQQKTAAK